ncbi:MAG: alpha/beta hydrolase [Myxacorys chilensis ATA2-1-KO14]|jgi:pimeloyl-ACP methyl ester carboxylesterase|nr:alpha/beta hydrolase [Myxacorys chilensis ATA2-1-KO14]
MPYSSAIEEPITLAGTQIQLRSVALQVAYAPGRLPAIVCIHGGLGSRYNWRLQWEFLRASGQAVLAYDLAGHGDSRRYQRYSVGRHRRDLTRLLRHFQIENPILCCHSYGVPIGLEWAKRHPTRAIIAIAGGTHDLTPWWEIPAIKFFALFWNFAERIAGHNLYRWQPHVLINSLGSAQDDEPERSHDLPTDPHPYEAIEAFWGYDGRHHEFACPITIITGSSDPMFPPVMGHKWLARLQHQHPNSTHITVSDVGHLIMAEAPGVVNDAILQSLV